MKTRSDSETEKNFTQGKDTLKQSLLYYLFYLRFFLTLLEEKKLIRAVKVRQPKISSVNMMGLLLLDMHFISHAVINLHTLIR